MTEPIQWGRLKIVPVPPGHKYEPAELSMCFDKAKGVVYVREADWPKLRDELRQITLPQ